MIKYLPLAILLALGACATPYKPMGFMGGVDDLQLSENTYRITARGNGYTDPQRVQDFVLLRASEIAIARGYKGFVIASETDQTRVSQITSPGYSTTNTSGTVMANGGFGTLNANSTTTYVPPTTTTWVKPGAAVIMRLVRDGGMDAQLIYAGLAPKYGVKPPSPAAPPEAQKTN